MGFYKFKTVKYLEKRQQTFQGMQNILNHGVRQLKVNDRLSNDVKDNAMMRHAAALGLYLRIFMFFALFALLSHYTLFSDPPNAFAMLSDVLR